MGALLGAAGLSPSTLVSVGDMHNSAAGAVQVGNASGIATVGLKNQEKTSRVIPLQGVRMKRKVTVVGRGTDERFKTEYPDTRQ